MAVAAAPIGMEDHRHAAVGAGEHLAAVTAQHHRRGAAAVEEEDRLSALRVALAERHGHA